MNYTTLVELESENSMAKAVKRAPIRFKPDPLTVAYIDNGNSRSFTPQHVALAINESYSGCAVLIATSHEFKKGDKIKIKVGQLSEMKAKVVWCKNLEENIYKMGIQFLE